MLFARVMYYVVIMFFPNSKEEGEKYHQTRQAIQPANTPNDTERSHDPFPIPRSDNAQPNPFAEFMSMMAKNMGPDGMKKMGGMMSMMGALMGGAGMPSPPTRPEEPTSTVLDIARSSSTSPDSGLSSCSMMPSPNEAIPDSTTESACSSSFDKSDSFDASTQRYSESSCSQFDDGYCSGNGQRFSSSTSSPYTMDPFSPYSDTFLPSNQPPTMHAQMYIKEEYSRMSPVSTMSSMSPTYDQKYQHTSPVPPLQQTSSYNPHCCYNTTHLTTTHIKQEPLTTPYRPEPYSMSPQSYPSTAPQINLSRVPVSITSEVFPATLPVLNDKDLQILDLEQSLRQTMPTSYCNPCTH